ncbi:YodD family peroxide/acid resistance protein [Klebsiella aerogenes]
MKSAKDRGMTNTDGIDINVDALLAAINEISESEVHRSEDDPHHVSIDGRNEHTWRELAEAFELDIHDFSVTEANR